MMRLYAMCIAAALALASAGVAAQDLSGEQANELRERAQMLQAERERNPAWDGGTRRLNEPHGDVRLDRDRGEVKTKTSDGKRKREPVRTKVKRAVKNVPGALVRKR